MVRPVQSTHPDPEEGHREGQRRVSLGVSPLVSSSPPSSLLQFPLLGRTRIESKAEYDRNRADTHFVFLSFSFLLLLSVLCVWYDIDGMEQPGHARCGRRGRVGRQVQRESRSFPFKFDYHIQSWILGSGSVLLFRGKVQAADTHHLPLLHRSILLSRHIRSYTSPSSCGNAREQIRSLPTVMAFKDGQPISQFSESADTDSSP